MKILLVEDEQEKKKIILQAILEKGGVAFEDVTTVSDVFAAKRAMTKKQYDLLILDINIPLREDKGTKVGGGLEVLQFMRKEPAIHAPAYVVGMTAYDDGFDAAAAEFSHPLWKLIRFSFGGSEWKISLQQAIEYLVNLDRPPYSTDGSTYRYDLGIVVGLEDQELSAVLDLKANWQEEKVRHDSLRYFTGSFQREGASVSVVVAASPRMGMPSAAVTATKLIHTFRPETIAIAGICAGVAEKTQIGDILVADPIYDWGSGKWVGNPGNQRDDFIPAPYQLRITEDHRSSVKALGAQGDMLRKLFDTWTERKPSYPPKVIVNAMASGGAVLQSDGIMEELLQKHKNLIGIEMESYAVFVAAEHASDPKPKCISIKSVCDFGGLSKDDSFHEYAAYVSANFLYEFALKKLAQ